jgi:serine/threonine protein kinase
MKKVGRYVIVSELGRGAMGVVYRASDPTIDRDVALKVLSLSQGQEEGTNSPQEMFMREVRAAGRLAHPSIVTIYDAFDDPVTQSSCIVMELVPGVTLEKMLESGKPPTVEQSLGLIRQVAEALDYAHRNKVIHRDLKPANILVTEDGRAKITDFGIAKVMAREGVARTIGIMGTPSYMSPEQVRGGDIDARTDVFSLGIMIFTMLTGQKPFTGNTAAVMFKIVYEDPALPSTVNTTLDAAHDYVVRKCLAKDRNQRYSTVRDLLNDLDDIQNGVSPRSQSMAPAASSQEPTPVAEVPDHPSIPPLPVSPEATAKPQAPRMPPPATPLRMEPPAPRPSSSTADPTVAMPRSEPKRPAPFAPLPRPGAPPHVTPPADAGPPQGGKTLVMQVPDLAGVSSPQVPKTPPAAKVPPAPPNTPLMGQTLPMRVPDLSAVSPQQPHAPAAPPTPQSGLPLSGRTLPMQVPDLSAVSLQSPPPPSPPPPVVPPPAPPVARPAPPPPQPPVQRPVAPEPRRPVPVPPAPAPKFDVPAPPPAADSEATIQLDGAPEPVASTSKSKLIPVVAGIAAVVLLAAAGVAGYLKFHKSSANTPVQEAVKVPDVIPPPVQAPPEALPPAPVTPMPEPAPQAKPTADAAKKALLHKTRQPAVAHPQPAPQPQPQPAPQPPPQPVPAGPSPAEVAREEAAKLASTPRIINVVCSFGLKEATFTFTGGGKTLYQGTEKGKKKKAGFLGLKGNYEGAFNHTLTVPAGVAMIAVHVESKDGSMDVTNTTKLPAAGGFVPTLSVQVEDDHLTLNWKGAAGAL